MGRADAGLGARVAAAREVAARHAADVDAENRFPDEAVAALRDQHLLEPGCASGADPHALSGVVREIAGACGSTGLILAMHHALLATLLTDPRAAAVVRSMPRGCLVAGVTSEMGTQGIRESRAACVVSDGVATVIKRSPAASYVRHADVVLVSARRTADAGASDQVAVWAARDHVDVDVLAPWDAMGMRGTCSIAAEISVEVPFDQVLATPFGDLVAEVMLPLSHLLWASCWSGIAHDAARRAREVLRKRADGAPGGPANHRWVALAEVFRSLHGLDAMVDQLAHRIDRAGRPLGPRARGELGLAANELRLSAAEVTLDVAVRSMSCIGIASYAQAPLPASLSRHVRDLLSAPLMVSPHTILEADAASVLAGLGGARA